MDSVRVIVTGMGRKNAEHSLARAFDQERPAQLLTCGFAGALDPALALNTVLYETTDAGLTTRLAGAGLRASRFHCAPRMAITAAEKAALRRETNADAVEMESGYIHSLCRERGVPCATVRVISDTANEDLPLDFNALTTREMKLDFLRLALAVAGSPRAIPGLLRLRRQTTAAADTLASALERLLRAS